jgi:hypothetical protein
MRQSKFTEEQIVALLREAEKGELTIQALAKDRGISAGKGPPDPLGRCLPSSGDRPWRCASWIFQA